MDKRTMRALALDGGGVRGYLSINWLELFSKDCGVENLNEVFDVIGGTSIGGIMALAIAYGKPIEEIKKFFEEYSKRIFTIRTTIDVATASHNASVDSNRPNKVQKVGLVVQDSPFYESAYKDSNYGSNVLHNLLVDFFGNSTLADLTTKVIIPVYNATDQKHVVFSNCEGIGLTGSDLKIVDVARATSAAPVYLPEYIINDKAYWDGGVFLNNSSQTVLNVCKSIKPSYTRHCLLSIGTGLGEMGFDVHLNKEVCLEEIKKLGLEISFDAINRIFSLFNIASCGSQEGVDFNMKLLNNNSLEQFYYYRFQPKLDEDKDTELDNSDEDFLIYLKDVANENYKSDNETINNFINHLNL